jgi:hypothetical protein
MLFIPRKHQDKLLQHSYAFSIILQNAIKALQVDSVDSESEFDLIDLFTNIKKILMTRVDNIIQDRISEVCTDKETVIVSDGTIRAFHNIVLTPEIISTVNKIPFLLKKYTDQLKQFGTFFDALPIEVHGKTQSNQQLYLIAIENNFILAFSSGKGRLGSLFRTFREILWDLNIQTTDDTSLYIPSFPVNYHENTDYLVSNQFLNYSFEILKSFSPIISNASLLRCNCNMSKIESLRLSDKKTGGKHGYMSVLFTLIHKLCQKLFRTSLIQIIISQHGFNSIVLRWTATSSEKTALYMVGDSVRGVGLLKLVGDQILEQKTELGPISDKIHLKIVSE